MATPCGVATLFLGCGSESTMTTDLAERNPGGGLLRSPRAVVSTTGRSPVGAGSAAQAIVEASAREGGGDAPSRLANALLPRHADSIGRRCDPVSSSGHRYRRCIPTTMTRPAGGTTASSAPARTPSHGPRSPERGRWPTCARAAPRRKRTPKPRSAAPRRGDETPRTTPVVPVHGRPLGSSNRSSEKIVPRHHRVAFAARPLP